MGIELAKPALSLSWAIINARCADEEAEEALPVIEKAQATINRLATKGDGK